MTDIDAAHAEADEINRTRDRIDRWARNGGLSSDLLRRIQADVVALIEADMDKRPWRLVITGV